MQDTLKKGYTPILAILVVVALIAVGSFLTYSFFTGQKYVATMCKDKNLDFCKSWEFQSIDEMNAARGAGWATPEEISGQVSTQTTTTTTTPTTTTTVKKSYPVKEMTATVKEPYSLSWTAYSANLSWYDIKDVLSDPNTVAFDTTEITSGAGSETSWNKISTEIDYQLVIDGNARNGGSYYDTLFKPFSVSYSTYNPAVATYSLKMGDDVTADNEVTFLGETIGAKLGTWNVSVDAVGGTGAQNGTGGSVSTSGTTWQGGATTIWYNESSGGGQFSADITFKNNAANTLIKDAIIEPFNDQTNQLEGNEFTAVTIIHKSGTDFGIKSNALTYITNYVPLVLGNIEGGESSTDTWTFTVSETNFEASERLHLYFDDLGGYRNHDVLISNLGVNAVDLSIIDLTG